MHTLPNQALGCYRAFREDFTASIFKFARLLKPSSRSLDSCIYNTTADNYLIQFVDKCTAEHQIRLRSFLLHILLTIGMMPQYTKPSSCGPKSRSTSVKTKDFTSTSTAFVISTSSWDKV
ncbi:hypothetical protein RHMOL_Rhmol08G0188900 [Rhododendron molle]|uniref:Uncharacterized protein n=1 Tax=Rhododendron molle TaxID=49168 RepID=A0ACC0MRE6_RHOML|nr:hypothetical protein RHMOL_Rhmol08G0188900 [Rhododendron molle]